MIVIENVDILYLLKFTVDPAVTPQLYRKDINLNNFLNRTGKYGGAIFRTVSATRNSSRLCRCAFKLYIIVFTKFRDCCKFTLT